MANLKNDWQESDIVMNTDMNDIANAINSKLNSDFSNVSGGAVPISNGGTGATTAASARTNLGLGTSNTPTFNALNLTNTTVNGKKIYTTDDFESDKIFRQLPDANNVDLLNYMLNLGYGKTGWFMATDCTNRPSSLGNWWQISILYNTVYDGVHGGISVIALAEGLCYSNHYWGDKWQGWRPVSATDAGIVYVCENDPWFSQNGDLWAW